MLDFSKTIGLLAMMNSVHWHGHVLRMEGGHVLRRALDFEVKGQRRNGGCKGHGRSRLRKKTYRLV